MRHKGIELASDAGKSYQYSIKPLAQVDEYFMPTFKPPIAGFEFACPEYHEVSLSEYVPP
jgi:hypothetical protein